MRGLLCLNPVSPCPAILWNHLFHCLPQAKSLAIFDNCLAIIDGVFANSMTIFAVKLATPSQQAAGYPTPKKQ
jgi:hypothetical protein